ncbi:MAG: acyltransferase [Opitutae bacterium]|nr:acyltransferase [Opitutae bacterium]
MIGGSQLRSLLHSWRAFRLRSRGAEVGPRCRLAAGIVARRGIRERRKGSITIGRETWIEDNVVLDAFGGRISLGESVYLGPGAVVFGHGGVTIGDHCLIAMHCRILSSNHPVPPLGTDIRSLGDILLPTKIGRDVWLGAGVTVLGGVTVGDGCVIGAGAVVTKDLPPGAIAYGVPAAIRSYRPAPTP